jgi:hypothetical protein
MFIISRERSRCSASFKIRRYRSIGRVIIDGKRNRREYDLYHCFIIHNSSNWRESDLDLINTDNALFAGSV